MRKWTWDDLEQWWGSQRITGRRTETLLQVLRSYLENDIEQDQLNQFQVQRLLDWVQREANRFTLPRPYKEVLAGFVERFELITGQPPEVYEITDETLPMWAVTKRFSGAVVIKVRATDAAGAMSRADGVLRSGTDDSGQPIYWYDWHDEDYDAVRVRVPRAPDIAEAV